MTVGCLPMGPQGVSAWGGGGDEGHRLFGLAIGQANGQLISCPRPCWPASLLDDQERRCLEREEGGKGGGKAGSGFREGE